MSNQTLDKHKSKPKAFSRNRKLPLYRLVLMLMRNVYKNISLEIRDFLSKLQDLEGNEAPVSLTKGAFSQRRKQLKYTYFEDLFHQLTQGFYQDNWSNLRRWRGYRLLAVDGSLLELPNQKSLAQKYGRASNGSGKWKVQARLSMLYDVLNGLIIEGTLASNKVCERTLALAHLSHCQDQDLLIYDRGYPSFDFIYEHHQRGLDFVMRVKLGWNKWVKDFVKSGRKTQIISFSVSKHMPVKGKAYDRKTKIKLRLVRVILESGEVEVLVTSLLDQVSDPNIDFGVLYFQRWKIETRFDVLKNCLHMESFSGY